MGETGVLQMRAVLLFSSLAVVAGSAMALAQTNPHGPKIVYPPTTVAQRQMPAAPAPTPPQLGGGTIANPLVGATVGSAPTQLIELRQGSQTTLTVTSPFSSVAITDVEVVDALPRSDRVLILQAKKPGSTDITIFSDATNVFHGRVVVSQPLIGGTVYLHDHRRVGDYTAYQCNPVCFRTDDKFQRNAPPELVVVGGGGSSASATSGPTIIMAPPGAAAPR